MTLKQHNEAKQNKYIKMAEGSILKGNIIPEQQQQKVTHREKGGDMEAK